LHSDLLLLCGGNLLQDETSRRSLKYYRFVIELAHTMGKRVYMLSSGFGSFISRGGFSDFLRCLKLSSFSGARTSFDYSLLSSHCEDKGKIRLMPDLCFLYSGEKYKKRQSSYFAVILSRGSGLAPRIKELAEEYSLEPIFIGLFKKEDRKNANLAASQFSSKAYFPESVDELFKLLSLCRFTLSTRLHGGIFSLISRTPCLLACNCEKNRAFVEEISKRSERLGIPCPLLPLSAICRHTLPETEDKDFNKLLTTLRDEVTSALDELFGKPI
jgi:polysaccharide pyruvyl transferase WcaK-like protein